ncbi:MAG: hypothetical protein RBQ97_02275 [Acholeplasma sp.]|nr:hypothetical protein [Acholeplasma sp.]
MVQHKIKKSQFYIFSAWFFIDVINHDFFIGYFSINEQNYLELINSDQDKNYLVVADDLSDDELSSILKYEEVDSYQIKRMLFFNYDDIDYQESSFVINEKEYNHIDSDGIKNHYLQILLSFFADNKMIDETDIKDSDYPIIKYGNPPENPNEILISENLLIDYGIAANDILNHKISYKDGEKIILDDLIVTGVVDNKYDADIYYYFRMFYNKTLWNKIINEYDIHISIDNTFKLNTYENVSSIVNELKLKYPNRFIYHYESDKLINIEFLFKQKILTKEVFNLLGIIILFSIATSSLVSIIFRVKKQLGFISVSKAFGLKNEVFVIITLTELFIAYTIALFLGVIVSYGIFYLVDFLLKGFLIVSLIPSFEILFKAGLTTYLVGLVIIVIYTVIITAIINKTNIIKILRKQ